MIKLSVSQAARQLGVSRGDIQAQINMGKLQTHEGYVTTDSIRLAYPKLNLHSEQDKHIQKMQQIKVDALHKFGAVDAIKNQNEQTLITIIASLKSKLHQKRLKNNYYQLVLVELGERLQALEKHCHQQDKASLRQLQDWVREVSESRH